MDKKPHTPENRIIVITSGLTINSNFLYNFISIISKFSEEIIILTSRVPKSTSPFEIKIQVKNMVTEDYEKKSIFCRIITQIISEILISFNIILSRKYGICMFFLSQSLLLPIVISKLFHKRVILHLGASISDYHKFSRDKLSYLYKIQERISFKFADKIIIYSPTLIASWNLENYEKKIIIAHEHVIDTKKFRINQKYRTRKNIIGYVGRLTHEKGILNFIKSIKILSELDKNLRFSITGDGYLKKEVSSYLIKNNLNSIVSLNSAIKHEEIPNHLNKLKLVVIPSYTEGLPNVMIESMACGTPVLANNVGVVSDFIKQGYNGYIMKNNSPETIADCVSKIMNHPHQDKIITNGITTIKKNFIFQETLKNWFELFDD